MNHIVLFESNYSYMRRFFYCTHSYNEVIEMAKKSWDSAKGVKFPFLTGIHQKMTKEEIAVIRTLFGNEVKRTFSLEEKEKEYNDQVFIELLGYDGFWHSETVIHMIFRLAQLVDEKLAYKALHMPNHGINLVYLNQ